MKNDLPRSVSGVIIRVLISVVIERLKPAILENLDMLFGCVQLLRTILAKYDAPLVGAKRLLKGQILLLNRCDNSLQLFDGSLK